jgi:hypothetical protein
MVVAENFFVFDGGDGWEFFEIFQPSQVKKKTKNRIKIDFIFKITKNRLNLAFSD